VLREGDAERILPVHPTQEPLEADLGTNSSGDPATILSLYVGAQGSGARGGRDLFVAAGPDYLVGWATTARGTTWQLRGGRAATTAVTLTARRRARSCARARRRGSASPPTACAERLSPPVLSSSDLRRRH